MTEASAATKIVTTNARTNRILVILAGVTAFLLLTMGAVGLANSIVTTHKLIGITNNLTGIANTNKANGQLVVDCTTPPPHPETDPDPLCYEDGYARSLNCVGWLVYAVRPPACEDVRKRIAALNPGIEYPPVPARGG